MNILVVGCGKVGARLAMSFVDEGHDVSVLARSNSDSEMQLDEDFGGSILCGVPIDQDNLKKAGIESCDVVCAVTGDDNTNIMVAQLAKEIYGIPKVITRILDPERGDIFSHFGLETVSPTRLTVEAICSAVKPMLDERYINFGSHMVRFTTMDIPKEYIDEPASEIQFEDNERLFAIIGADGIMRTVENYDVVMREGDKLIFSKIL